MRVLAGLVALSSLSLASASIFGSQPDLEATASFADDNPLSIVYNGQPNVINVKLVSHASGKEISIDSISGAFREVGGKERHLANTTAAKYSLVLPPAGSVASGRAVGPVDIPYRFYSELKPQDIGFTVYVDYSDPSDLKKEKFRTIAYDGTVTIKEPKGSWFDIQLLILYPLVLGLLGLPLYWIYTAFVAPKIYGSRPLAGRTQRSKSTSVVAKSPTPRAGTPTSGTATGVDSDWIPQHHLKTRRTVSGRNLVAKGTGGVTPTGNVTSDGETSGNESATPRRSARPNKGKRV